MTETIKTHYRKVFKSDYLGVADLEEYVEAKKELVFQLTHVCQELNVRVAGKSGDFNIAYFKDSPEGKPLVLNAGNSKIIKKLAGGSPFVEDWNNILVELYIDDNVRRGKEMTSGVRIHPNSPKREKQEIILGHPRWEEVKKAFVRDSGFDNVLKRAIISEENMKLMRAEVEQVATDDT
ncbi:hypothetical protein LCGC14_1007350 [marine sediment metagenome]|uniref:Uncharacterized protein n=1 Tax=marine sediment metagenome TaxID=412755 RepID=A0A0F9R7H0_9ZZZZ